MKSSFRESVFFDAFIYAVFAVLLYWAGYFA